MLRKRYLLVCYYSYYTKKFFKSVLSKAFNFFLDIGIIFYLNKKNFSQKNFTILYEYFKNVSLGWVPLG